MTTTVVYEPIDIRCADNTVLRGHFFATDSHSGQDPVLLSPAIGVRQFFYFKFCQWLCEQGHDVLVFDYRGIGASLHGRLKDCDATLQQWGELDQAAALDWLIERTGREQVAWLGHSAGGQMLGLLPNYRRIARAACVSSSSGYVGGMPRHMGILSRLVLGGVLPASAALLGYGRCREVGLGENLPAGVALQWRDWCSKPGFAFNSLGETIMQDFHDDIMFPITALYAPDDFIASRKNVDDLLRLYPNADKRVEKLEPSQFGYKRIGHINMFRSSHNRLWPVMLQALIHSDADAARAA